jgi:hypothetical protein
MAKSFYVAEASHIDTQFIVSGYPEGTISVGLIFTRVETVNIVSGERIIKAEPRPLPQKINIRVMKIVSNDQELPELSELSGGHLVLEGVGMELIQRGVQIFE